MQVSKSMTASDACATKARFPHHRSTGKERDAESGNDYFGARYYASSMGRFMSPDWSAKIMPVPYASLDDPQSLNLYSYLKNNPLGGVDADGHCGAAEEAQCAAIQQEMINGADAATALQDNQDQQQRAQQQSGSAAQQQSSDSSSKGTSFWSHVGNLLQGHSWNYGMRESVTMTIEPGSESEPNPYIAVGTDALGVAGAATGHPGLGYAGSAISVENDPSVPNLVMTGASFVPVVGEAVGAVTAVQDVGLLVGKWITNNVMAPMINSIPGNTMDNGNGISIPTPEAQCVASGMC
jgi:RHS repeat-associated protein